MKSYEEVAPYTHKYDRMLKMIDTRVNKFKNNQTNIDLSNFGGAAQMLNTSDSNSSNLSLSPRHVRTLDPNEMQTYNLFKRKLSLDLKHTPLPSIESTPRAKI